MANVEVKLVKADYVKFLEEVASIKAPKRSKLLKVTEMASMFLDDYEADEKGTTVAELEENVQKVLEATKELKPELAENIKNIYDAMVLEATLRKPAKETKKKPTPKAKKEETKKKQPKKEEEAPKSEFEARFPKEVEIGDDKFYKVDIKTLEELQGVWESSDLFMLSYWGSPNDFDMEDYDSLGVVDELHLLDGYDLMQVVFAGDKTAIAVSNYNEVNTTLLQDDLDNKEEQLICFYIKEGEEE